jgi:hypothetical protein
MLVFWLQCLVFGVWCFGYGLVFDVLASMFGV